MFNAELLYLRLARSPVFTYTTEMMWQQSLLLLYATAVATTASSEVPRPLGVGPECLHLPPLHLSIKLTVQFFPAVAKYYKDPTSFTCISNPSITLTATQVNDDYCDCPDGSDEPGTSACSHLSPLSPYTAGDSVTGSDSNSTPVLPGFYCKNKGHQPSYIPFTTLNDGVCDYEQCCDGSDEWAHVGGIKCEDKCKDIGKEWRKHDEARQKSMGVAAKRRKELAVEAARLRQEVVNKIETLEKQVEGLEIKIVGLQRDLTETERQERGKLVKKPKEGGKLGSLVQLAKDRMVELREALIEVRSERDLGRSRVEELEGILKTFKEEYNPNFNDEGVKRAVRAWEDYAAKDKAALGNEARDRDLNEIVKPEEEAGPINWADYAEEEESDTDVRMLHHFLILLFSSNWLISTPQSINSKPTSLPPSGPGSTPSSAPSASSLSKTAFSPALTTLTPNRPRSKPPATPSKPQKTIYPPKSAHWKTARAT